jgi:CRP-like cAMP-binding protein
LCVRLETFDGYFEVYDLYYRSNASGVNAWEMRVLLPYVGVRAVSQHRNRLLGELSAKDRALIEGDLETVDLPLRRKLAGKNRRIDYVYFLDSGVASILADGAHPTEVGLIGREGVSAIEVVLGAERSHHEVFMQVAGTGRRIRADILRAADEQSDGLHRILMRFVYALYVQISQTAVANARLQVHERLARWLLLTSDRTDRLKVPMTHEFLSVMTASPRPGVTIAVQHLAKQGLIESGRGQIIIVDRAGLQDLCKGAYEAPNDE